MQSYQSQSQNINSRCTILKHKYEESNNIYSDKFYNGIFLHIIDRNGSTAQYISDINDYRRYALKYILKLNYFIEKQYLYNQEVVRAQIIHVKSLIVKRYGEFKQIFCFFRQNPKFIENIINDIHYFKYKEKILRKNALKIDDYYVGDTYISQLFTYIEIRQQYSPQEEIILIRNNLSGKTTCLYTQKKSINFNFSELIASYDNKFIFVNNQLYSIKDLKLITQIYSFTAKFTEDSKYLVTYDNNFIVFYNLSNLRPQHIINYNLPKHSLNISIYQIVIIKNQIIIFEKNMNKMYSIDYEF